MTKSEQKTAPIKQTKQAQAGQTEQACEHDWQYDFERRIHACAKCGIPAPEGWNEVPF